jgi:hypothetical protein
MQTITVTEEDAIVKAAWLEWIVTHLVLTGDGDGLVPRFVEVEHWFILRELGLGANESPSIFWTLVHLKQINRAHRAMLACRDLPEPKRQREQDEAEQRRREWRAVLKFRRAPLPACA